MDKKDSSCINCQHLLDSSFADLGKDSLACIDHQKVCNLYKKGQVIFHEGNRPLGVYCIKKGKVKIYKMGLEGKEQIVRMAAPGDLVGYRAFLGEELYSCTAATLEDSLVCFIDRNSFQKVLKDHSDLSQDLLSLLSRELREAEDRIRDMAQKSVRERLAEVLVLLKNKFGMDPEESDYLAAKLSRDELASYVGTATETTIRLMSEFKEDKIIETQGKKIKILNLKKLVDLARIDD